MKFNGSRIIAASTSEIWQAMNNPDVLKLAIPGCQEMTGSTEQGFEVTIMQNIGPMKVTFGGEILVSNIVPDVSYTITGQGKGRKASLAQGIADISMMAADEGTELSYQVTVNLGDKLSYLSSGIVDAFAQKMVNQFFENFKNLIESSVDEVEVEAEGEEKKGWFKKLIS